MRDTSNSVTNNVRDLAAGMKDRALKVKEKYVDRPWVQTRDYMRENPGKTILVSAALGAVLGRLLLRRRPRP